MCVLAAWLYCLRRLHLLGLTGRYALRGLATVEAFVAAAAKLQRTPRGERPHTSDRDYTEASGEYPPRHNLGLMSSRSSAGTLAWAVIPRIRRLTT